MKNLTLIGALALCTFFRTDAQSTNGLVAHWNFNGSTNDVHNTHHGTPYGISPAAGKAGLPNTAYYFSDTNSYIDIPYQSDINLSEFTISAVVKVSSFYTDICQGNFILTRGLENTNGHYGMSFCDHAFDNVDCYNYDTSKYTFYALRNNASFNATDYQYSPTITTGKWYCVTLTGNNQATKIYVDGVLKNTSIPTGSIGSSTADIRIGKSFITGPLYKFQFNGYLDDMKIYNRVLHDTEVVNYCNSFNPIDDTTNNDTGTYIKDYYQPEINLYPNPNKGNFRIAGTIASNHPGDLQMLNAVGQVVYADRIIPVGNTIQKDINLSGHLPAGIYIIQYKTGDYTWTRRVTIRE